MHADITHQNGIFGKRFVNFNRRPLWVNGAAVITIARCCKGVPFSAIAINCCQPFPACCCWLATMPSAVKLGQYLPEKGTHISHQAKRNRIIPPNFFRININMDQSCWRDGKRIARNPRAGGAVIKSDPKRQQNIGLPTSVV